MKNNKIIIFCILILGTIFLAGCSSNNTNGNTISNPDGVKVTLYKSQSCGCCAGYASALERQGFNVETVPTSNMAAIKDKYDVPSNMGSCHTAVIGDYFVEGHVPFEAIEKLLQEKPAIDGIALPGMPSGSPGMPGSKTEKWTIYSISNGQATEFMVI